MKRISSSLTFYSKKVLPTVWFGFLSILILANLLFPPTIEIIFIIFPVIGMIFGYFIFRILVFDLMDEVWDEGNYLSVKNHDESDKIEFSNIKSIKYSFIMNPNRVTITLKTPCKFGNQIAFLPLYSLFPFIKHKKIVELIDRINKQK